VGTEITGLFIKPFQIIFCNFIMVLDFKFVIGGFEYFINTLFTYVGN